MQPTDVCWLPHFNTAETTWHRQPDLMRDCVYVNDSIGMAISVVKVNRNAPERRSEAPKTQKAPKCQNFQRNAWFKPVPGPQCTKHYPTPYTYPLPVIIVWYSTLTGSLLGAPKPKQGPWHFYSSWAPKFILSPLGNIWWKPVSTHAISVFFSSCCWWLRWINPFNASCSKSLLFQGFNAILV